MKCLRLHLVLSYESMINYVANRIKAWATRPLAQYSRPVRRP